MGQTAVVFVFALAARLLYLLSIRHADFFSHLLTEPQRYQQWSAAIVGGAARLRPPFDEAPAYPYLLAAVRVLFGPSVAAAAAMQAVLDAASCAALALIARRISGPRAAWIAATLSALYGPLIYFNGELVPATLMVFAVALATLITLGAARRRRGWVLAGAAWSAAILVRSETVLALPLLGLYAYRVEGARALRRVAVVPAALIAASLAVNVSVSRHWVPLTTGAGVNLWLGNNPLADGVNPFIHGSLRTAVADINARAHDPVEADTAFARLAERFWREHPASSFRLLVRKLMWTFTDRELPNTSDIDWQTSHSWMFHGPWFPLHFGVILPLGIAGVWLLWKRRDTHLILLASPVAIAVATSALCFTNARFRLVLVVALIPLAAHAIDETACLLRQWRDHARTGASLGMAMGLGVLVSAVDFDGVKRYAVPQIDVNTGALERASGNTVSAIRYLERGVAGDPDDSAAWIQLALAFEESGRIDRARATWAGAKAQFPSDALVRQMAARFVLRVEAAASRPPTH